MTDKQCRYCRYWHKRWRRSGECYFHAVEVWDTKHHKLKARCPVTFQYHLCKFFQPKEASDE